MNKFFELEKTNIMVEFSVIGDLFNPELITDTLSIEPSQFWVKGGKVNDKGIQRKDTCWSINTGYEESLDINNQLGKIISQIKGKRQQLIELRDTHGLFYKFDIIINIEDNEKPAIYLDREIIEFANDIKAEFDFDLYIF